MTQYSKEILFFINIAKYTVNYTWNDKYSKCFFSGLKYMI